MRPEPEFGSRSNSSCGREAGSRVTAPEHPTGVPQHSSWHSPVPYLFGGLAAMLGLIALALLVLACSYWKLSGYLDSDDAAVAAGNSGDGRKPGDDGPSAPTGVFEEKVLVIMAGDCKPTYLATPVAGRRGALDPSAPGRANDDVDAEETAPEASTSLGGCCSCPSTQSGDCAGSGCNRERGQNPQNKPQQ